MGRIRYGYLRCPPGFKDKARRRGYGMKNVYGASGMSPEVVAMQRIQNGILNSVLDVIAFNHPPKPDSLDWTLCVGEMR